MFITRKLKKTIVVLFSFGRGYDKLLSENFLRSKFLGGFGQFQGQNFGRKVKYIRNWPRDMK